MSADYKKNIEVILARNNDLINEKFKRIEDLIILRFDQNNKDHQEIIDYQKKQNGQVKQNCTDIDKTNKDIIRIRQGKVMWYLMTVFATLSATLVTYLITK